MRINEPPFDFLVNYVSVYGGSFNVICCGQSTWCAIYMAEWYPKNDPTKQSLEVTSDFYDTEFEALCDLATKLGW